MGRIKAFLVIAFSVWFVQSYGQSCDCPTPGNCAPCAGGFKSLTLRFNGASASTIRASDQQGDVFNAVVNPGSTFTFSGSIPNDKFAGPSVSVYVNGVLNATIDSNCGGGTTVGSVHGSFTVVAAVSKTGGAVCCSPGLEDTELPVISNCPTTVTRSLTGVCTVAVTWTEPTATDNCSIASFSSPTPSGSQFGLGTTQVTYTATDAYGNTAVCTFDVIVTDNTLPTFNNCPSNIVVTTAANCKAVVNWVEPTAADNCAVASTGKSHSPNTEFSFGTTLVTYTATDPSGNTGTCSFTVTVEDNIQPTFTNCPSNMVVAAAANCKAVVNWVEPTATDNCAVASTNTSHSPNSEFSFGTTLVTYTVTDASGNIGTCSFTVTVEDNIQPVFTNCPANIVVASGSNCKAVVNWVEPIAIDNCSVASTNKSHSPNSEFSFGTTPVTYTVTDASGNTGTCTFTVTVEDSGKPVFSNCPTNITVAAGANCKAVANWSVPSVADNCGIASVVSSHTSGAEFDIGPTPITYTATDINGNISTCTFTVTVASAEAPQVTGCPGNLSGISDGTDEAIVTWTEPEFTSRCGTITVQRSHIPGSRFRTGNTEVVYTASDGLGNTTECKFRITIELPELDIEVSKLVTPDGDGYNDFWKIVNLESYPNNHVTIFDRWGSVLYKASGYDNQSVAWRGTNKNNTLVPTGTYFYVLEVTYGRQKIKREGFIELLQ